MTPLRPLLIALLLLPGCGGTLPATTASSSSPAPGAAAGSEPSGTSAEPPPKPLPAGLYFRDGYLDEVLEDPVTPRVAVLGGLVDEPSRAEARARELSKQGLGPGYPLVVHTDELGLEERTEGIVLVVGLFETADEARAWIEASDVAGLRVAALLDDDAYRDRLLELREDDTGRARPRYRVARLDPRGDPVVAYPKGAIDAAEGAHWRWRDERGPDPLEQPPEPACELEPGRVFVVDTDELRFPAYRWTPVTCGDRPSYVRHGHTRMHTVIVARPGGGARGHQLVGVECDEPRFRSWPLAPEGEHATSRPEGPEGR